MGFWRSIGRTIGKGMEKVGKWTGSELLEKAGQGLQSICQEVSYNTGQTDSYDKEKARLEETRKINMILTEFSLNLEKKADEIEKNAIQESKVYFEQLMQELKNASSTIEINTNRIKRTMSTVEHGIKGNLKMYISKRVSIDDNECLEVLKMDAGASKEKAMKDFSEKILKLGLTNLVNDIKGLIKEQNDIINDVVVERLNEVKLNLDQTIKEFDLLEQSKSKTEQEVKLLQEEINSKIQLCDECIKTLV